ncbi:MAG: hypothetical protein HW421_3325 [Ignavibacteria bacterium]|nr:hypothetical protein [Ignavibacteria bacterium]
MSKKVANLIDIRIDKLTRSIENSLTGEIFETDISIINLSNIKLIKKTQWIFDWHKELFDNTKEVYKLTTINNPTIIHGLISLTDKGDHIFMNLIENAKFNKGREKLYKGVAGNLVAFACKLSFEKNYEGIVSFIAKTQLIEHYKETLGAKVFGNNLMYIDTKESMILVNNYFKGYNYDKL